jgi:hypothetical protein
VYALVRPVKPVALVKRSCPLAAAREPRGERRLLVQIVDGILEDRRRRQAGYGLEIACVGHGDELGLGFALLALLDLGARPLLIELRRDAHAAARGDEGQVLLGDGHAAFRRLDERRPTDVRIVRPSDGLLHVVLRKLELRLGGAQQVFALAVARVVRQIDEGYVELQERVELIEWGDGESGRREGPRRDHGGVLVARVDAARGRGRQEPSVNRFLLPIALLDRGPLLAHVEVVLACGLEERLERLRGGRGRAPKQRHECTHC